MTGHRERSKAVPVFESDRNAKIYAYYTDLRRERAMPARREIDPSSLTRHLPYLYIANVVPQSDGEVRFRITLMGTELVEVLKQEGKDRFIRELDLGGFEQVWRESIFAAFKSKLPMVALDKVRMKSGLEIDLEHLVLPLSDDGVEVDRLIGCFDFPRFNDKGLKEVLDKVEWSESIEVEVPKRLLITNLQLPLD